MRKKDKVIQEAFEVYQSSRRSASNEIDDFYSEGFEDKIFYCIEKMHMKNPRTKARIICIGSAVIVMICLLVGFYAYYQSQSSVRTTQQIEKLWEEAYNSKGADIQERFIYADVSDTMEKDTIIYEYQTVTLNNEQKKQLEKYQIDCYKTEKKLEVYTPSMEALICRTVEEVDGREVYQLSDRSSEKYFVLKEEGEWSGLAKYVGISSDSIAQGTVSSKEICQEIFGLTSEDDVRSITLERFMERSKDNPEKLLAIYTESDQQKEFLSRFQKENRIETLELSDSGDLEGLGDDGQEDVFKEERDASLDDDTEEITGFDRNGDASMQLIEGTAGKTWEEVTQEMPEKCYLLGFESTLREIWVIGLVVEDDTVQIYIDTNLADEVHYLKLETTDQEWLSELVRKADNIESDIDDSNESTLSAKPIIYLYPEKKTNIHVEVDGVDFTTVYPEYQNGWDVQADTDGTLYSIKRDQVGKEYVDKSRSYYSLYYEGEGHLICDWTEGFIVEKKDYEIFLEEKLRILGLSDYEAEEFIIYWLPQMQEYDKVKIHFEEQGILEEKVPLTITPKPDTTIRVFMEWKEAKDGKNLRKQELTKVKRRGYTAVEWGGSQIQ